MSKLLWGDIVSDAALTIMFGAIGMILIMTGLFYAVGVNPFSSNSVFAFVVSTTAASLFIMKPTSEYQSYICLDCKQIHFGKRSFLIHQKFHCTKREK